MFANWTKDGAKHQLNWRGGLLSIYILIFADILGPMCS